MAGYVGVQGRLIFVNNSKVSGTIKYSLVCIIFVNLSILICIVAVDKVGKANAFCVCEYTSFVIAMKFYMNHGCKGITSAKQFLVRCQL